MVRAKFILQVSCIISKSKTPGKVGKIILVGFSSFSLRRRSTNLALPHCDRCLFRQLTHGFQSFFLDREIEETTILDPSLALHQKIFSFTLMSSCNMYTLQNLTRPRQPAFSPPDGLVVLGRPHQSARGQSDVWIELKKLAAPGAQSMIIWWGTVGDIFNGGDIHGQRYTGPPFLYGGAYPHTICFGEGDLSGFLLRFSCVFYPPMRFLYSILKL